MKELAMWHEIQADIKQVEEELLRQVEDTVPVLSQAARQMLQAGGKRLRPLFTILSAKCCGAGLERVLPLAVALEMIHMASLIHDDAIDASPLRRGQPTVWATCGHDLSLHIGNYLFARSLVLVATYYSDKRIPSVLASVSVKMVQGEMRQLASSFDINESLHSYLNRIYRKTALLIAASCKLGAIAAGAEDEYINRLYNYGRYLGMAFQITDDVLDMTADPSKLGKPIGGDLRQGIITLPAIYALKMSKYKKTLADLLQKKDKEASDVEEAIDIIKQSGGIEYSLDIAERYLAKARNHAEHLNDSAAKRILQDITYYVRTRGH